MTTALPAPRPDAELHERPVELLQHLIRFDTTSPPGNEAPCIAWIDDLLTRAGCRTTVLARTAGRPNLFARLPGEGRAPPLLLYGHVDVVSTAHQAWRHPPFAGDVVDGEVWGRGALDMKGGVAMMLAAFLRAKANRLPLAGDVILMLVSDEEQGGAEGTGWLVDAHPELFAGIRHALGEFGAFTITVGSRRFYPIMVTEKAICRIRATVSGPGGHGSLTARGGAAARLGELLRRLDAGRLPAHVTPVARDMFEAMAAALPFPAAFALRRLLNPRLTRAVLALLGAQGRTFEPLLHDTVNVVTVAAGEQTWGVPSQGAVTLAASLLPGRGPSELIAELREVVGPDVRLEVLEHQPVPSRIDMGLFGTLGEVLREADPEGVPIPLLFPTPTDARHLARLGIQTYGFLPMRLPPDFPFASLAHAADERIPAEAVGFGADAMYRVLERYGPA